MSDNGGKDSSPGKTLSVTDAVAIILGVVIGAGIFKTPSLVASNSASNNFMLMTWVLGGLVTLIGALCYAELASTYPNAGGDYHYLRRAFGRSPAFLFGWARMSVIQSGSIAMLAFLIGDYASQVLNLGRYSSSEYAMLIIVFLTLLNIGGIRPGSMFQKLFIASIVLGLLGIVLVGLWGASAPNVPRESIPTTGAGFGRAMIFVLLTYGGWNEAAYLSAEVRGNSRSIVKALFYSIGLITLLYLLINLALIRSMGLADMSGSEVVAADLMRRTIGDNGAKFISLLIALAAFSTMNGSIITGARTNYALGRDFKLLEFLGRWHGDKGTPVNALLLQSTIALFLVAVGTGTRNGFVMMVEYTAPVFWFFFLMTGVSLFILRWKEPDAHRPFRVPLYPVVPLIFCIVCGYMLMSSLTYTGRGALLGMAVLLAGVPFLLIRRSLSNHVNLNKEVGR